MQGERKNCTAEWSGGREDKKRSTRNWQRAASHECERESARYERQGRRRSSGNALVSSSHCAPPPPPPHFKQHTRNCRRGACMHSAIINCQRLLIVARRLRKSRVTWLGDQTDAGVNNFKYFKVNMR